MEWDIHWHQSQPITEQACFFIFNLLPISVQPIPASSRKVITLSRSSLVVSRCCTPGGGNSRTPFSFMMLAEIQLESITAMRRCLDPSRRGIAVTYCGGLMVMIATAYALMRVAG